MKKLTLKYKQELIGALIGGVAGLLYWRFVGCSSGSCAITSDPVASTAYFSLMGLLLAGTFGPRRKKDG